MPLKFLILLLGFCVFLASTECPGGTITYVKHYYDNGAGTCPSDVEIETSMVVSSESNFLCYVGDNFSENCTSSCLVNNCNGDNYYCANRTCNIDSNCYCKSESKVSILKADCGLGMFNSKNRVNVTICQEVAFTNDADDRKYTLSSDIYSIEVSTDSVRLSLKSLPRVTGLTLMINEINDTSSMKVNSSVVYLDLTSKKRDSSTEIEWKITPQTQSLIAFFEDDQVIIFSKDYGTPPNITTDDFCSLGYCEYCSTDSDWVICRGYNFGYIKIALIVIVLMLLMCFLPWIIALFTFCGKCCKCMCCTPYKLICCNKSRKIEDNSDTNIIEMESSTASSGPNLADFEDDDLVIRPMMMTTEIQIGRDGKKRNKHVVYPSNIKPGTLTIAIICIFAFGSVGFASAQCTTSAISSSSIKVCTRFNNTHTACTTRPTVTLSVPGVGSTSCIGLTANNTTPYGTISVTFKSHVAQQSLNKNYYTSSWQLKSESSKSCFLESCCTYNSYGDCSQWADAGGEPNPCGKFSSGILSLPGKTICSSTQGCAGCGCFSCANACMYSRYAFAPQGEVFEVDSFSLVNYVASFDIKFDTQSLKQTYSISSQQPYASNSVFDAQFQGVFLDFGINWGGKRVVINSAKSSAWIADTALTNSPNSDIIGDIQSDTVTGLTNPSSNSFQYARTIVSWFSDCHRTYFSYAQPGMQYLNNFPKFPTTYTGFLWSYNPSVGLTAPVNRVNNALVTITLKQDLTLYILDDLICPYVEVISTSGCFHCPESAIMTIKFRSTCQPGSCVVSTGNFQTLNTTIYLSNTLTTGTIAFYSNIQNVVGNLTITCKERSYSARFNATLIDPSTVYERAPDGYSVPPAGGSSTDLGGLFGVGKTTSDAILAIIIIVAVIVILIIITVIIFKVRKNKNPDESLNDTIKAMLGIEALKKAQKYQRLSTEEDDPKKK